MRLVTHAAFAALAVLCLAQSAWSQVTRPLEFATVHRPPFAILDEGTPTGFSIDLMTAIGESLGRPVQFHPQDSFADMLDKVRAGEVHGAIANISITAAREREMDFSQPIFESGLQILLPVESGTIQRLGSVLTREILVLVLVALGVLFGGGLLMWLFERRHQPYFDRPMPDAMFPSFWWALNLVVNGGFEERMPMSRAGRMFAVMLVVASLFIVSIFVATITAAVTVDAIQENVVSINDLEGRRVATVSGSTSSSFLAAREIDATGYTDPAQMLTAFVAGEADAVVFDGPILAYFVQGQGRGKSRLIERVYRPENYGIALPSGSTIREDINQTLLHLREDGTYDDLVDRWFGANYRNN
ncbi:transporter substrate-binding domain-containing protein [uncultured Shimia sp.]|uniref:transporter substrate-binding domain-containing protein n=1 Tax=uncultured Shimia sp. TaxID=573152 RepID=UPI00260DB7DB|nr:transporter substrate-binding domain-containing protein [uncultured Shimia sp.]